MIALGIETSCDETSAAIVRDGKIVLSNVVASSLEFHKKYGGVIPEIASRIQLESISEVTDTAVKDAHIGLKNIDLICVTNGPGLLGSLLVGISFAKSLSLSLNIPLLGVNHVHSHFYANFLNGKKVKLPFVGLVVSGGHTNLYFVKDFNKICLLGETRDDACGEAFDKVAKILGLGYPGGPIIEKLAKKGDPKKIKFNCASLKNGLDFSFSGIKTAVLYHVKGRRLSLREKQDICASFQEAVISCLIQKSFQACKLLKAKQLVIGGGVVANSHLRERFIQAQDSHGIECFFPQKSLCMDNAAMVCGLGYQLYKKGYCSGLDLTLASA
jgi:N6-L-threonylcarbamoyladenine synthase